MRGHPVRQVMCFAGWLVLVVAAFDFGVYPEFQKSAVYPSPAGHWLEAGLQCACYALVVAPIVIWSPATLTTLRAPWWQITAGLLLVAAGILDVTLVAHVGAGRAAQDAVKAAAAGFGEELAFRGFIWERTRSAGLGPVLLMAVNAVGFAAWHLVAAAAGTFALSDLPNILILGVVLSVVRLCAGNTGLPALLHTAFDIRGFSFI